MMNRYQHQHPPIHNSNTTFPSNHHFHLSSSTTTTTTTVLQTPIDTYSSNNNSILDLHPQNHYNLLDDNYVYNPPPSYCTKHHPIYRSPPICTLDSQPPVYETYTPSTNIPVNTYEQLCIDNSQTSPSSSSWVTTTSDGSLYHPIQSFDQCNIYLNNSQLSEQNYRDYPSIPLSNNETSSSSSSTSSTSSFNNLPPSQQQQQQQQHAQYRHPEQSSTLSMDEKPLAIVANEAKYKWLQIKRTPAKTAGKIFIHLDFFFSRTYV
jgi:hypothetical protein